MRRHPLLITVALASLLVAACGPTEADEQVGVSTDVVEADSGGPGCHQPQLKTDGDCCPEGTFYHFDSDSCVAVGPPECAAVLFDAPESCVPRWCWDLRSDAGLPCAAGDADCRPVGRTCSAAELEAGAGCAAGMWPDMDASGACRVAGSMGSAAAGDADGELPPLTGVKSPDGVPPLGKLPALLDTRFCQDKGGKTRICQEDEQGCGPGKMPDPDAPGDCMAVGVPWLCPPGFVLSSQAATSTDDLAPCEPDPADCGEDPFGGVQEGPGVHFLDASAAPGGDGTRAKPFNNLATAVTETVAGGTVAIAAGKYEAGFLMDRSVTLHGRCASMVQLNSAKKGGAMLKLKSEAKVKFKVGIRGVTLRSSGWGVAALPGVTLHLERVLIEDVRGYGVAAFTGKVLVEDSLIRGGAQGPPNLDGVGVVAAWGGRLDLRRVRLSRNRMAGIFVQNSDTEVSAEQVLIDGTRTAAHPYTAHGLASMAARARLRSVRVSGSHAFGIRVIHQGSNLDAAGVVVDRTGQGNGTGVRGEGMYFQRTSITLAGVRLHDNRVVGLYAGKTPTTVEADGLIIDATRQAAIQLPDHLGGGGMLLFDGPVARMRSVRISDSRHAGLGVERPGTRLEMEHLLVHGTRPLADTGQGGPGVVVRDGASAVLRHVRAHDNRAIGVATTADKPGDTKVELIDVVIDQTRPTALFPDFGAGVSVEAGARAQFTDVRLSKNVGIGVQVVTPESSLVARRLTVDDCQPNAEGKGGVGLSVSDRARVTLVDGRFSATHQAAIGVQGVGTQLVANGVHVEGTRLGPKGGGVGLGVLHGADVTVQGSRFVANTGAGIFSNGVDQTVLRVRGSRVEDTLPDPNLAAGGARGDGKQVSLEGSGLTAWRPDQQIEVTSCLFRANHGTSIYLDEPGGSVTGCAVVDTRAASFKTWREGKRGQGAPDGPLIELADGIRVLKSANMVIRYTLVVDQLRAGFLLDHASKANVSHSVAARGQFGVALAPDAVATLDKNPFFGNVTNIEGNAGLFVPPPPTLDSL